MQNKLHVDYIPKLITKKKQRVLRLFIRRFYTPYVLLLWVLIALEQHACATMRVVLPCVIVISSIHQTSLKYKEYRNTLDYLMETSAYEIDVFTKCYFLIIEFIVQCIASALSFWWLDDVHSCVAMDRSHQSVVFVALFVGAFVAHVLHHFKTKKHTEYFVRSSYRHVDGGV